MNERIKELAEQAAEHAVLNPSEEILQSETEDAKVEVPKEFIDKFAELIVRECGKSCTLQGDEDDMFRKFGIKHFGVEL